MKREGRAVTALRCTRGVPLCLSPPPPLLSLSLSCYPRPPSRSLRRSLPPSRPPASEGPPSPSLSMQRAREPVAIRRVVDRVHHAAPLSADPPPRPWCARENPEAVRRSPPRSRGQLLCRGFAGRGQCRGFRPAAPPLPPASVHGRGAGPPRPAPQSPPNLLAAICSASPHLAPRQRRPRTHPIPGGGSAPAPRRRRRPRRRRSARRTRGCGTRTGPPGP
jgi:hypothetical protein